jgi:hypothetical protein
MFGRLRSAISSLIRARPEREVLEEEDHIISEEMIWDEINASWTRMTFEQRRLWEMVKIMPNRWAFKEKPPHGTWVVAILGRVIIRYDDTDCGGFVLSLWTKHGVVNADFSGEGTLEESLQIMTSYFNTSFSPPPEESPR